MSRLNTLYPDDEFLKGISNVMGKIDSKDETEIKQEIEQIGYKEFYRYFKEKDVYIKQLKEKINTYENPEDLTLMFMYCDEKAKDKIKELKEIEKEHQKINGELREENKQLKLDYELYKDNHIYKNYEVETKDITIKQLKEVIEEVREYIDNIIPCIHDEELLDKLLQILDKGVKDE